MLYMHLKLKHLKDFSLLIIDQREIHGTFHATCLIIAIPENLSQCYEADSWLLAC